MGIAADSLGTIESKVSKKNRKVGVLLVNVGTPSDPSVKEVRRYLAEFLMDKRVVDLPGWLRTILVYGLILPFRPKKSAKAYQAVWDKVDGSPLLSLSRDFTEKLQIKLGDSFKVVLAMRYGQPNLESALATLKSEFIDQILIAPLYPQYASATTSSALEKIFTILNQQVILPSVTTLKPFYAHPSYISAKTQVIKPYLDQPWDAILFSYHGLPFSQIKKSENKASADCYHDLPCPQINNDNRHCYRAQCYQTTRLLAQSLGLKPEDYMVSFQSRVGMNRWIGPDTDAAMKMLMGKGKKNLLVVCPSFVTDCLETLEEIALRAKEDWQALGGGSLTCIPCLNDSPAWIEGFADIIQSEYSAITQLL